MQATSAANAMTKVNAADRAIATSLKVLSSLAANYFSRTLGSDGRRSGDFEM
jgi:hypothetical protein